MKLSYFDRYERSHRPLRAFISTDTSVHIDRSETTLRKVNKKRGGKHL